MTITSLDTNLTNEPPYSNQSWGVGDISRQSLLGLVRGERSFGGASNKDKQVDLNGLSLGAGGEGIFFSALIPTAALVTGAKITASALLEDLADGAGSEFATPIRYGPSDVPLTSRRDLVNLAPKVLSTGRLTELYTEIMVLAEGSVSKHSYSSKVFDSVGSYPAPEAGTSLQSFNFGTTIDHILSFSAVSINGGPHTMRLLKAEVKVWRP